ncbi:MAG: DNA polymerase III subunit beta [bacterium]
MKLSILQENLSRGLSQVSKAVSNKPSIPILSNVLLTVKKDTVKLSGTDLEIGMNINLPAEVISDGSITINAKLTSEFVLSLPAGKLTLELTDNVLNISNDQTSSKFSTISAEDFPIIPVSSDEPTLIMKGSDFFKAVSKTVVSAALDDSRPVLTGILFEFNEKFLTLVGVDGFRLSKKLIELEKKLDQDKLIIPAKALNEVLRVIDPTDSKEEVKIYVLKDKNQVVFAYKELEISTRLIEGEFPDYKSILPSTHSVKFTMSKDHFSSDMKIVNVFAKNVIGNKTVFEVNKTEGMLVLSSSAPELGENKTKMEISDVEGDEFKTAYNARYLMNMIGTIEGDEIVFESNGPTLPAVFKDPLDTNFTHIVMPMKLD